MRVSVEQLCVSRGAAARVALFPSRVPPWRLEPTISPKSERELLSFSEPLSSSVARRHRGTQGLPDYDDPSVIQPLPLVTARNRPSINSDPHRAATRGSGCALVHAVTDGSRTLEGTGPAGFEPRRRVLQSV